MARALATSALAILCLGVAACSSTPKHSAEAIPYDADKPVVARPAGLEGPLDVQGYANATDPTAERLQDICGALLWYYANIHRMPKSMTELAAFSDENLDFTSPASHRQFVYRQISLKGSVDHPELVMYDPDPMRDGTRWGIVGAPAAGDRPIALWVVRFNQLQMNDYLRPVVPLNPAMADHGGTNPTTRPTGFTGNATTQP
jgi:hypothetical protein